MCYLAMAMLAGSFKMIEDEKPRFSISGGGIHAEGNIHPLARPYFFQGRKAGCLLIHGFTGSPPELLPLAEYLAERGYAVAAPLLAGHGTCLEDLSRTSWRQWLASARVGWEQLAKEPVEKIFYVGLSMGGLLALLLAAENGSGRGNSRMAASREKPLGGVVTINSPVWLKDRGGFLAFFLQLGEIFFLRRGGVRKGKEAAVGVDLWGERRFAYPNTSPRSVVQLLRVIGQVRRSLGAVKVPALVVQSKDDETVEPRSAEYIYRHLGSREKRLLWVEKVPHVLPLDAAAGEQVFPCIVQFIEGQL